MFFIELKRSNNMGSLKHISYANIRKAFERIGKEIIKLIREEHLKGKNLLGQSMNTLGNYGNGYTPSYMRSGDFIKYGKTKLVNLHLTGAFHNSLNFEIKENRETGTVTLDVKADFRRKNKPKRILKITSKMNSPFPQFETFLISPQNKQMIFELFRNSKKIVAEFYFLQMYLKIMEKGV